MTPIATVVVTAFDREDSLQRLLLGFNNQSVSPGTFELVIADDSGDSRLGERILLKITTTYDVSLVRTDLPYEVNGVSVARNLGIKKARGEIIISIDDDCFPSFYFIEEHLKAHRHPYPAIVLGHRTADASKLNQDRPYTATEPKAINELIAGRAGLLNFSNFMTGNISFPKRIAMEAGLFDETFAQPGEHGYEDIELGYRFWRKGIPTVFSNNAMIYRPPTEMEKAQGRTASKSVEKASRRILKLHPLMPTVRQFMGAVFNRRTDQALEYGVEIIKRDPRHWPVLLHMGEILGCNGQYEAAHRYLAAALALYSRNPAIYLKLAQLMHLQKRDKEALQYSLKSLQLNPEETGALYLNALVRSQGAGLKPEENGLPEINIELGGGLFPTKIRDEGHGDYINLDAQSFPAVDVVTDLSQTIPLPDGVVSHIFSREMIEHLPYRKLPGLLMSCYRVLKPGGKMYLGCPDFDAIIKLYDRQCDCFEGHKADPACPHCNGTALISSSYWRSNLLGDQNDYGDGGHNDTHKNQITYASLSKLLAKTGFVDIHREMDNPYYESEKRLIKLSVACRKPL